MGKEKLIHQCCYCGSIEDENEKYDMIKREIIREGNVSHGICPLCFEVEMNKLEMMEKK